MRYDVDKLPQITELAKRYAKIEKLRKNSNSELQLDYNYKAYYLIILWKCNPVKLLISMAYKIQKK